MSAAEQIFLSATVGAICGVLVAVITGDPWMILGVTLGTVIVRIIMIVGLRYIK